ncbi:hypothetical protein Tco_0086700 [Tanacetum coccineum]
MMYALAGPYMGKIVDAYADTECMRRDYVDRKSTNGICTSDDVVKTILFVREIEKTTLAEISTTKAMNTKRASDRMAFETKGTSMANQALISRYDVSELDDVPHHADNKGVIDLSKNPMQHSRTKHIEIRHHFLRDNVQKGQSQSKKASSSDNIRRHFLRNPLKPESLTIDVLVRNGWNTFHKIG